MAVPRKMKTAQLFIVTAAILWSMLGVVTRPLGDAGFSLIEIVASRSLITSVCLFVFILVSDRGKIKIKMQDIRVFIAMGGIGIAVYSMCYFKALELLPLSVAAALNYTSPYIVMLMSVLLFKEKITVYKVSALMIAFTGCVLTVGVINATGTSLGGVSSAGVAVGIASAFGYAFFTLIGKFALKKYHPFTVNAYAFTFAFIMLIPFCDIGNMAVLLSIRANLRNMLALGIFMTTVPFVCYTRGLRDIESSRASIIAFIEPFAAAVVGLIIYDEMLTPLKILGMALIFVSMVILNLKKSV